MTLCLWKRAHPVSQRESVDHLGFRSCRYEPRGLQLGIGSYVCTFDVLPASIVKTTFVNQMDVRTPVPVMLVTCFVVTRVCF